MCSRAWGGTPGPLSMTSTTASDGVSDRRIRTRPDCERLPFLLSEHAEMRDHIVGECGEVDSVERERWLLRAGTREREQPIDQLRESIDFLQHAADDAAIRALVAMTAQADFADAANSR